MFEAMWFCAVRSRGARRSGRASAGSRWAGRACWWSAVGTAAAGVPQRLPAPRGGAVHRGVRAGQADALRCPYHAWTYGLDGKLVGAPNLGA